MIARASPAATLGAIQPQTSVHRTRRVAGLYAQGETDTERTQRTKRGPLGCRGKSSDAGTTKSDCSYKTRAAGATSCQRVAAPVQPSRPALSAVSALCPFLDERRDQPVMAGG